MIERSQSETEIAAYVSVDTTRKWIDLSMKGEYFAPPRSLNDAQVEIRHTNDVIVTERGEGSARRGTTPPLFRVDVVRSTLL